MITRVKNLFLLLREINKIAMSKSTIASMQLSPMLLKANQLVTCAGKIRK